MTNDDCSNRLFNNSSEDKEMDSTRIKTEKLTPTPTTRTSGGVWKNGRDDIFQAIVGLKVMKGEKENTIKGYVTTGFKNPENKEAAWICNWEAESSTTQHNMQEIDVLLKNANDPALIDMKLSLIKSPAFFAMSTLQPFRKRRVERANNASDN